MPSSLYTALYDANVIYSAYLRDLLMQLALSDLYRARWTKTIHEEWIRNLLNNRPDIPKERLYRIRDLMNRSVRDCLIEDYEGLIPALSLPDADDRHVLAAAIKGRVDVIVTFNDKDFPASTLATYDIEVQHPDNFIEYLIDLKPYVVLSAAKTCRDRLKNPSQSVEEYLDTLIKQGLTLSVSRLRELWYEA